jgi:hypothetical protein
MRDLFYLAIFFGVVAGCSGWSAYSLAKKNPLVSRARILILTPLPIPAMLLALCTFVVYDTSTASAEECGVDACAMAAASAMYVAAAALVVYFLGMIAAELGYRWAFARR